MGGRHVSFDVRAGAGKVRLCDGMGFVARARRCRLRLRGKQDRRAKFICALSVAWPPRDSDGTQHCETVEGTVSGTLVWPPRGDKGFGYDPMFVPDGCAETFGEMEPAAKHAISHRADAFRKLVERVFTRRSL